MKEHFEDGELTDREITKKDLNDLLRLLQSRGAPVLSDEVRVHYAPNLMHINKETKRIIVYGYLAEAFRRRAGELDYRRLISKIKHDIHTGI